MKTQPLLLALALGTLASTSWAQTAPYPNKPIRLVVGFAPGGAADYVARSMSEAFSKALGGQTVIVENKPGNGSSIAADIVAKAAPDGYTMLIGSPSAISVNPALNPKLTYKPSDLMPITKMTTSPLVLAVTPTSPIKSVPDLIAAAKKDPGKLNYSSSGNGSAPHLGAALFGLLTGTEMTHVPYRGGAPMTTDLIAVIKRQAHGARAAGARGVGASGEQCALHAVHAGASVQCQHGARTRHGLRAQRRCGGDALWRPGASPPNGVPAAA